MKKIFLLLAISCLGFSEELVYDVKIFGINAGTQKISKVQEGDRNIIRLISETKTNAFFSAFYKVDDYIEAILERKTFLPEYLPQYLLQKINEGKYHGIFEAKFDQKKKIITITSDGKEKEIGLPEKTYDIISLIHYLRNTNLYSGRLGEFYLIIKGELKKITIIVEEKNVTIKGKNYDVYEVGEEKSYGDYGEKKKEEIRIWFEKESKIPLMIKVPTSAGAITAVLKR
ncbi:DUF3108 domain-containing protein [bacterium]|nr:DUF3108 domain-containing protein [bacterium]MBU1600038.1 DUF3108 domain-containing protein [bacterium]MBU2462268.1 DUF3108 domain-containing protein [bacterium]